MTPSEYEPRHRVLLVEDNPHEAAVLQRWLSTENRFDVSVAADGALAADLLREQPWSLIVSDLRLPNRSGLELLHDLRRDDESTPFLLMSAQASTEDACVALRDHANDFLLKPLDYATFTTTARTLAGSYTDSVRRRAVLQSRLENRKHAQFLSVGRSLTDQLVSPLTRLTISADLLLAQTRISNPRLQAELDPHRTAIDLAVRDANTTLGELRSLLGMGLTGIDTADLVAQARAAAFLAGPALTARGAASALSAGAATVMAAGSVEGIRTVLTSVLLSLAENATELQLTGLTVTVEHHMGTPAVRIQVAQRDARGARDLLGNLCTYFDMMLMPIGGFVDVRTEVEGSGLTLCFQRPPRTTAAATIQ